MSSIPERERPEEPDRCPLCATPVSEGALRCASCGYHLAASDQRTFGARALLMLGALVAVVYVISLGVVLAAR